MTRLEKFSRVAEIAEKRAEVATVKLAERVRGVASELGVSPALAEELLRLLIRSSLTTRATRTRPRRSPTRPTPSVHRSSSARCSKAPERMIATHPSCGCPA